MDNLDERMSGKQQPEDWAGGLWLAEQIVPHLHVDKLGGTTGEQDRLHNPGSPCRKTGLKTSGCKNLWGFQQQEKLPDSQDSSLERPTGS